MGIRSLILLMILLLFSVGTGNAALDFTYSNFGYASLGSDVISDAEAEDDTFTVGSGTGARFPSTGMFFITIYDYDCDNARTCATKEVIKIKSRSTDTFTIKARNQEGTTHTGDWAENDKIELAVTGGGMNSIITEIGLKLTGTDALCAISDADITNIEADPATVRTSVRPTIQALDGVDDDESAGIYLKIDPSGSTTNQLIGIYGEITSEQQDTEAAFMKIVHEGAGDAIYVPLFTEAGVAFEAASFTNGTKGIISTLQTATAANTVLFNALWEQDTIPNYGLMYFDHAPANSILIRKTTGADAGYSQFRLMDHDLSKSVFNIYNNGKVTMSPIDATADAKTKDSPDFTMHGEYWDGAASVERSFIMRHVVTDDDPASSEVRWLLGQTGFESIIGILRSGVFDTQGATFYSGDIYLNNDAYELFLGTALDAKLLYDGTDMLITTNLVAPSDIVLQCGTDKTLELAETVWEDLRILPGVFDLAGSSDPAKQDWQPAGSGTTLKVWGFDDGDGAYFTIQLPHSWKEGTNIYSHIHWTPGDRGNEEGTATVGWALDCSWADIEDTFPATTTYDLSDACQSTDHEHLITQEVALAGSGLTISSMIACKVYRNGGTWSGTGDNSPILLEVDFHYEIDTIGSRGQTAK